MNKLIEHLETKPESKQLTSIKNFLKKQTFIKEHLKKGGSIAALESMGYKFGKVDLSNPEPR